jgi:hypothetical protein
MFFVIILTMLVFPMKGKLIRSNSVLLCVRFRIHSFCKPSYTLSIVLRIFPFRTKVIPVYVLEGIKKIVFNIASISIPLGCFSHSNTAALFTVCVGILSFLHWLHSIHICNCELGLIWYNCAIYLHRARYLADIGELETNYPLPPPPHPTVHCHKKRRPPTVHCHKKRRSTPVHCQKQRRVPPPYSHK